MNRYCFGPIKDTTKRNISTFSIGEITGSGGDEGTTGIRNGNDTVGAAAATITVL